MRPHALLLTCAIGLAAWPSGVHANGAFPDGEQLLFPASARDTIFVGTNFGLVLSEDGGESWQWVCESRYLLTALAHLYQLGAGQRLFAVSNSGLVRSDDAGCTWSPAGGALEGLLATDAFVDPRDPTRVFALAQTVQGLHTAHASDDGGLTFDSPLFTGRIDEVLTGIEAAPGDTQVLYLASYMLVGDGERVVQLSRSMDDGLSWERTALSDQLAGTMRIVLVDPDDPARVFMRLTKPDATDQLIVTEDGGETFRTLVRVAGPLRGFLRMSDGTYIAAGETETSIEAFRSRDGGRTFESWALGIRARAFAERDGVLYALASEGLDGHAMFASEDGGKSWKPVMRYADITGPKTCVAALCTPACTEYSDQQLWPAAICPEDPAASTQDAGAAMDAAAPRPRIPTSGGAAEASGCGVSAAARRGLGSGLLMIGLLLTLAAQRRRRS